MTPIRKTRRGFTLIEVMIVVAIVAILASIAYPSYQRYVLQSYRAQAQADLMELAQFMERRYTATNTYAGHALPFTVSPRDGGAGRYNLSFEGTPDAIGFVIQAERTGAQASDRCGTLSIDQRNSRTAALSDCW